jgi:aminopeptidase N
VPVLKRAPSPTEQIVEGLEPYFAQKREEKRIQVELAAQQERIRAELAAKLKLQAATASDVRWGEIANRWRLELQAAGQENNNKVLQDILQGYHPSKNSEYVIKILQSSLPMEMKKCVIEIINEQAKLYKKKNKDE